MNHLRCGERVLTAADFSKELGGLTIPSRIFTLESALAFR
jgi:hypothetical protein